MKPISGKASLLNPNDGVALRTFLESLRTQLASDRSTWDGQYAQLAAFFQPYSARFDYTQANTGQRQDFSIINETGLLSLRTLQAGMLNGMSPPTRPWFKFKAEQDELNEMGAVRRWCEDAEEKVRAVLLKSNFYETVLNLYGEEGLYGTSAFLILEDDKTVIRCHPYPIGEYYLGVDDTLRVDLAIRLYSMTVRQIVERFGYDACSDSVKVLYDSNAGGVKETRYPIVHAIHKGSYFDPEIERPPFPWISTWYEQGTFNPKTGILRKSGFLENPLICGRWRVVGEDVYGRSPGMDVLGSTMSLQAWEERLAQAAEKQFNPPMIASADMDPRKLTTLPGDIVFADTKDISGAFKPAYQIDFRLEAGLAQVQRIEARIKDGMYQSLFQMFSESDRKDITAEEIRARQQEKMTVLGPVVERNTGEVHAPSIVRVVSIMQRKMMLPPLPPEMKGKPIKIEFTSILAQAQKIGTITNLSQFIAFLGSQVAVDQSIMDNVDMDAVAREFAELGDVPEKVLRDPAAVQAIRADRAKQQQMAIAAENAQKLAAAGKNMSETQLGTGSALDAVLPSIVGGQG